VFFLLDDSPASEVYGLSIAYEDGTDGLCRNLGTYNSENGKTLHTLIAMTKS
jgi:hypothetical protein